MVERQLSVRITPDNVHLLSPLTTFGEYEVPLRFPKSIHLPEGKVQWTLAVKSGVNKDVLVSLMSTQGPSLLWDVSFVFCNLITSYCSDKVSYFK
uniref:Uncharacterized protein n=1 Tax=Quercus lobata TaxID=97700 RepID=A0A7N2RAD2_QUELO